MQVYGARKVDVRVDVVKTDTRPEAPVGVALLGIASPDHPWLSQLYPGSVVRATRMATRDAAIEHLRFVPAQRLDGLPGIDSPHPSLIRDSVRLALDAGAPFVDVVLVRAGGALPWQLDNEHVLGILNPYLPELQEAQVALPDLGGPAVASPGALVDEEQRYSGFVRALRGLRQALRENYQIAYVDLPEGFQDRIEEIVMAVDSADIALCRWTGTERAMRAHGWRSAASALAALQVRPGSDLTGGVAGLSMNLGGGRRVRKTRHPILFPQRPAPPPRELDDYCVTVALDPSSGDPEGRHQATVLNEPTLRAPTGAWTLPALRTVKAIHHRVVFAAEQFVFRPVDQVQAFSLVTAIDIVLRPFIEGGALVGPGGEGGPLLAGNTIRDRDAPGLVAEIAAQLRPWCQDVRVRVAVDPGKQSQVEVLTA